MLTQVKAFFKRDAASGVLLVIMACVAMVFANTGLYSSYQGFLNIPVTVAIGAFEIAKPLLLWINDGLMAIFFLLVGLEMKREVLTGHLSSPEKVILPGIGAAAGIIFPAVIFLFLVGDDAIAKQG